jgi:thymidylate kinase
MLVVIEGSDGIGKSTLLNNLIKTYPDMYKKFPVTFPTYKKEIQNSLTPRYIRDDLYDYLIESKRGEISDLYFQLANLIDKVSHVNLVNECKHDKDYIYLMDRYKPSGFVYGTLSLIDSGMNREEAIYICEEINKLIIDVDFEVFLHLDIKHILERINKRNEKKSVYENEMFLKNIIMAYQDYFPKYVINGVIVDASLSEKELVEITHQHIIGVFENAV